MERRPFRLHPISLGCFPTGFAGKGPISLLQGEWACAQGSSLSIIGLRFWLELLLNGPENIVRAYLEGNLVTEENLCDHQRGT